MNLSLFLAQTYWDAWGDYQRSLWNSSFPVWDIVVLTASGEDQAECFERQIAERTGFLSKRTRFVIISDEEGARVGSGGATLGVLKWLKENGGWEGKRILVIHSGGDSKRVPQYSALGKLFSPVPHVLPDGRSSTLFDEILIAMSAVPGRIREGMLLVTGDVLLMFNPLLIDYSGKGAACISFKENVLTGKDHGVFLSGDNGFVKGFLHKQTIEKLYSVGAVNPSGDVDIDTGALVFGTDVLNSLWGLISSNGELDEGKFSSFVNDRVKLSLYGDFQYPMAEVSTLEQFYLEKSDGEFSEELRKCREKIWEALRQYRLKLIRLAPAKFIHFGTTNEILDLMTGDVEEFRELGWSSITNSSASQASYNSVIRPKAKVGDGVYAEVSYVHSAAEIGEGSILSYIDIHDEVVPAHVVLHGLKQKNGKFVCRIFGVNDNPRENKLFGRKLPASMGNTLWDAQLYPEKDTIKEAVVAALELHRKMISGLPMKPEGKSLADGLRDADPEAILAWNKRMSELVAMDKIAELIAEHEPASKGHLSGPLTRIQRGWLEGRLSEADYGEAMRLRYYVGMALGTAEGDKLTLDAFKGLSSAILDSTLAGLQENIDVRICKEEHFVSLPLRVNWGGGWSDTPPYCNENGGTVLNAAVLLNGERPVSVHLKRLEEKKIVFESRDMDVHGEFTSMEPLQRVGDPFDVFVLQKAALLASGVIPANGGSLESVLERLGGGFCMDTEVTGVPKGSGLGTSSILAAACVKALFEFLGIPHTEDDLYSHVLCMEQIMSTGGGWQDQVGGVTDGIKYITSHPGLNQEIRVRHLELSAETMEELNERFCLIYTGQRRLARNLLRDVVGRYIGNEPDTVYALNEIQRVAALMRFELEKGRVDEFAALLRQHWELSKMIDAGSTNTLIDQIFDSCDDLLDGRMVCGAGGGGFLQVVLKKGVSKKQLQDRLMEAFADTEIAVWDCTLV